MYRLTLCSFVAASLATTPVAAEVCIGHAKYGLSKFRPECAVQEAFTKAFDASGRPRPKMTQAPPRVAVETEGQREIVSVTYEYELALFDSAYFRELGRNDEEFSMRADLFSEVLRSEICQEKSWLELDRSDEPFHFLVKFRLNAGEDVNERSGFPRTVLVSFDNCEAN
ncbi:MAG: hypothetical protein NTW20_07915 [Rhodobacterales bacterium]|nr:hypothetical protein [Rhodobacterales bacterium]